MPWSEEDIRLETQFISQRRFNLSHREGNVMVYIESIAFDELAIRHALVRRENDLADLARAFEPGMANAERDAVYLKHGGTKRLTPAARLNPLVMQDEADRGAIEEGG
jgi:hypothetical protein